MKRVIFISLFIVLIFHAKAQCDTTAYNQMIKEGDQFAASDKYEPAVKRFTAAMIACPNSTLPQQKIVAVFHKIEELKEEAVENKKIADLEARRAQSITLAAIAREQLDKNPTIAIRLAELAWKTYPAQPPLLLIEQTIANTFYEPEQNNEPFYKYRLHHSGSVYGTVFSPDSKYILTTSGDNTAALWDAQTGKKMYDLKGHTSFVLSAVFSPDGKQIVTASADKTAIIWDAETGKKLIELKGHNGPVHTACFSPDGKRILTASNDSTAIIWDAASGKRLIDLKGHTKTVRDAFFSPDGKKVVTASEDSTAIIWDAGSGTKIFVIKGNNESVI